MNFVNFLGKLCSRTTPSNRVSHDVVFFPFLQISEINLFDGNGKLGEGSDEPVQCFVVMEIRWKPHCQVAATHGGQTFCLLLVTSH